MKVLFLALEPPYPLNDGGRIRTYNILKQVGRQHETTLLTFADPTRDAQRLEALRPLCADVLSVPPPSPPPRTLPRKAIGLFQRRPISLARYRSHAMARLLRFLARSRRYDVVHVDQIYLAQYAPDLSPLPAVLTHHNVEAEIQQRQLQARSPSLRRLLDTLEYRRWRRYEVAISRRFAALACVSERDAAYFRQHVPQVPAFVVPNGVDTQAFCPPGRQTDEPVLLYTGRMDYFPNVDAMEWFCKEVWPLVRREMPSAHLSIVGRNPLPQVQALSTQPGIEVTGAVEDVRPYMARAAVYIVPLRLGGGTRLKILEAMAMGLPIVSTPLGCEGLGLHPGRDLLVAQTPVEFAWEIMRLLRDPKQRRQLGTQARCTAETRFDWAQIVAEQENAYRAAVEGRR